MSRTRRVAAAIVYGLLVFAGTALFGFVIAPLLLIASGLFPIDTEARGAVSMLTLKGVPYLIGLAALSGALYPRLAAGRIRLWIYLANVLLAWLVAAAIALAILG